MLPRLPLSSLIAALLVLALIPSKDLTPGHLSDVGVFIEAEAEADVEEFDVLGPRLHLATLGCAAPELQAPRIAGTAPASHDHATIVATRARPMCRGPPRR